jgi:hypothetical protein
MDSRSILKKDKKLKILIDSESFNSLLSKEDINVKTLLAYGYRLFGNDLFQFVRSPLDTEFKELNSFVEFNKMYNDKGDIFGIKIIPSETSWTETSFPYRMQDIEHIGKVIFKKKTLNDKEKEAIFLVFVQAVLNSSDAPAIFITSNEKLLKNRLWLESHFPGKPLNIVTVDETKEIMDLFAKYNGKHYVTGNFTCNKGLWYWLSFRSKVPNFHVGEPFLDAFSTRFVYLLKTIDKIGIQYYLGVNNDTLEDMQYYLNYFIVLTSGIFDGIALATKIKYPIRFKDNNIPSKTSLDPSTGKEFLKALRATNPDLRTHINKYVDFIKLIYELREAVVHREIPQGIRFVYDDHNEKWQSSFIRINEEIKKQIHRCGDSNKKYDPISIWGVYNISTEYLLEPFSFAKSAARVLIEFSNKYLKLLGYEDYFEELKSKIDNDRASKEFLQDIEEFKKNRLGF